MPLFNLPVYDSTYGNNYTVYWGDGTSSLVSANSSLLYHNYPSTGTYSLSILPNGTISFNNVNFYASYADALDLRKIKKWGSFAPVKFDFSYYYASNLSAIEQTDILNMSNISTLDFTWAGCSSLSSFPLIDTGKVKSFKGTWYNCNNLTYFPLINTISANNLGSDSNFFSGPEGWISYGSWQNCSSLTSFPQINTSNVTNFNKAWYGCSKLKTFPAINTLSGTNFQGTWAYCTSLTSFPLINTSNAKILGREVTTEMAGAWQNCTSLSSFPLIDTSKITMFSNAWADCSSLTSFPPIDTSSAGSGRDFFGVWYGCKSLLTFPWINTSGVGAFGNGNQGTVGTWTDCWSLTSFPLIDTSRSAAFFQTWMNCYSLKTFPEINLIGLSGTGGSGSNVGILNSTWYNCNKLDYFPKVNTSNCLGFPYSWTNCSSLTSFPLIDTSKATSFSNTWAYCTSLSASDFPTLNMSNMTDGTNCFQGVKLTTNSYSSLLTSICSTNLNPSVVFHGGNSKYNIKSKFSRDVLTSAGALKYNDINPFFIKLNNGRVFYCGTSSINVTYPSTETYLGDIVDNNIVWYKSNDLPIPMYNKNYYGYGPTENAAGQLSDGRIILFDGSTTTIGTLSTDNSINWTTDTSLNYPLSTNSYFYGGGWASTVMSDVSGIYIVGGKTVGGGGIMLHFYGKIQPNNSVIWLSGYDAGTAGCWNAKLATSGNKVIMINPDWVSYGNTNYLNFARTIRIIDVNTSTFQTSTTTVSTTPFIESVPFLDGNTLLLPYNNMIGTVNFNTNSITLSSLSSINPYPKNESFGNIILNTSISTVNLFNFGGYKNISTNFMNGTRMCNIIKIDKLNRTKSFSRFGGSEWTITDGGLEELKNPTVLTINTNLQ